MQTTYSVDSRAWVLGQVAQTSLKQIDSFQLVNIDANTRSYAKPGDVVIRAVPDPAVYSTDQLILRANAANQQTTLLMIGIVVRDDGYGYDIYQSKLAVDSDNTYIKRDVLNIMRKGRIVVQVGAAVVPGNLAYPNQIAANFDTANIKYYPAAQGNPASQAIGVFVTSGAQDGLAVVEINCVN